MNFDVFVFGSNMQGIHGAGAAKFAHENHGAEYGVGEGLTGKSYALPTREKVPGTKLTVSLPIHRIKRNVKKFVIFANENPTLLFLVTAVGCGLSGYKGKDIAPLFVNAPRNCILPQQWKVFLQNDTEVNALRQWHDLSN